MDKEGNLSGPSVPKSYMAAVRTLTKPSLPLSLHSVCGNSDNRSDPRTDGYLIGRQILSRQLDPDECERFEVRVAVALNLHRGISIYAHVNIIYRVHTSL